MKRTPGRWAALTVAAGLALAGCATGTNDPEAGTDTEFDTDSELSGTLSVMGFGAGDEIATVRLDQVEAQMPDVEVQLIEGDLDIQQFLSAVAAGDPPELVYANRDQIGTFASRGAIVPLDTCIEGEGVDTGQYLESALAQVTFDDQIYGIPEFNGLAITQANADLLAAAGLTIDDVNGSDWDAATAATQALTKADGGALSVIGFDSKLPEFLPLWARANGVDLLSEDGRTAQLNDPAVVEALEWAVGIYDLQGGFGPSRRTATRRTSSVRATSSPRTCSARCRWRPGTSTCSARCRRTPRWRSTPCATARATRWPSGPARPGPSRQYGEP